MKKLLLVLSVIVISLSGCYVRGHDEGYHRDRDHHDHERDHHDHHDHDDDHRDGGRY